jgi:hypothetical protein
MAAMLVLGVSLGAAGMGSKMGQNALSLVYAQLTQIDDPRPQTGT